MDTAAVVSDTAADETSSPSLLDEQVSDGMPEMDVVEEAPETEGLDSPETDELTLDDPKVQELLKGERAKLEESYRRREENAQRQAEAREYERLRAQAYNNRVETVSERIGKMLVDAAENGTEYKSGELRDILTEVSATGLIETVEGMQDWLNQFLEEDNPVFFQDIPDEYRQAWNQARNSRRPDAAFAAAMKVAAASGEARGYKAGQTAALNALKQRDADKEKTQRIRQGSAARAAEGAPATGLSGSSPGRLTLKQIDDMPVSEWLNIGTAEERAKILEQAHKEAASQARKR